MLAAKVGQTSETQLWKRFSHLSAVALLCALASLLWHLITHTPVSGMRSMEQLSWLSVSQLGVWMAILVQLLGTVIGAFSSRYLQG
ncbi:MAG: NADH-quinone oxidoreductase subunit L, partial [Betaproteobacteria bacterium]